MSEKKVDCKYWDKCYQKNEAHVNKYNHPPKLNIQEQKRETDSMSTTKHQVEIISPIPSVKPPRPSSRNSKSPEQRNFRSRSRSPQKCAEENNVKENIDGKVGILESDKEADGDKIEKTVNLEEKHYFKIFHNSVHNSKKDEYIELLKTTDFIRHKFLVEMPDEFYTFWAFCSSVAKSDQKPEEIFKNIGLQLVGPFEYLAGYFNNADIRGPGDYLRHWRFYYDPPEFQTIFVKKRSGVHYGYWRDEPSEKHDLLIAKNDVNKGCIFEFVSANCFQVLIHFLEHDVISTPFNSSEVKKVKDLIIKFSNEHGIDLGNFEEIKRNREKKIVTKTFHRVGLVVPYERKTQLGYRPLIETDSNLKQILNKLADAHNNKAILETVMELLQPIITAANIAVDECDFGTSVELGIDLFSSGYKELHELIVSLLVPGYSMLKRPQFIAILKAHLEYRRKGNCLSIFDAE